MKDWAFYYTKGYWGIFSLRDLPYEVINKLILQKSFNKQSFFDEKKIQTIYDVENVFRPKLALFDKLSADGQNLVITFD